MIVLVAAFGVASIVPLEAGSSLDRAAVECPAYVRIIQGLSGSGRR